MVVDNGHAREFREQGFTVARGFFSADEAALMLSEVERCAALDTKAAGLTDNGIRYTGGIFLRSPIFQRFLSDQRLIDFLRPIAGDDLWITMDQAVTKHPNAGIFRWHQDNGYTGLKTEHFQLWIALTPTRLENGALKLVPGSHLRGRLPHKLVGNGQVEVEGEVGQEVHVNATAGDVILFSSLMLHATGPNRADSARVAYVAEYMPLAHYAPMMGPPHFVVAKHGKSAPGFLETQPGARSLRNQALYLAPRLKGKAKEVLRPLRDAIRSRLRPEP